MIQEELKKIDEEARELKSKLKECLIKLKDRKKIMEEDRKRIKEMKLDTHSIDDYIEKISKMENKIINEISQIDKDALKLKQDFLGYD